MIVKIHHKDAGVYNQLIIDYLQESAKVRPFVKDFPSLDRLIEYAQQKSIEAGKRATLIQVITDQYEDAGLPLPLGLDKMAKSNAVTVTTGHQLNLFGGPAYSIYKIASAIKIARQIEDESGVPVVPIFWMASEDHDFDEISFTQIGDKTIRWENGDTMGAVGRMDSISMLHLVAELKEFCPTEEVFNTISKCYKEGPYWQSHFRLIQSMFQNTELVILNADDFRLKGLARNLFAMDLYGETLKFINESDISLSDVYADQALVRDVNLFYLGENSRNRIERSSDGYIAGNMQWSIGEIEQELKAHPERFSPNVVLRPIYQESILPNIAYIGGPGEIAYWLQLKCAFEGHSIDFPFLIVRDSFALISQKDFQKWNKLGFASTDLFRPLHELESELMRQMDSHDFRAEEEQVKEAFDAIKKKLAGVDYTLKQSTEAEEKKAMNSLKKLEKKRVSALKRINLEEVERLRKLYSIIHTKDGFQERAQNFIPYLEKVGVNELIESCSPFSDELTLYIYKD